MIEKLIRGEGLVAKFICVFFALALAVSLTPVLPAAAFAASDDAGASQGGDADPPAAQMLTVSAQDDDADFVDFATDIADETRGTAEKPYRIKTEADLFAFAAAINADTHATYGTDTAKYAKKYFKLIGDVALTKAWIPVGISATKYFAGSFDGDGHTISGLDCTNADAGTNYLGLFGYVKTLSDTQVTIENVKVSGTVADSSTSTSCGVGGIVGYAAPSTTTAAGAIPGHVTIENCVSDVAISGGRNVGGILGYANTLVDVKNCLATGNIAMDAKGTTAASYGGGIVGAYASTNEKPDVSNNLFLGQINTTDATMNAADSGNAAENYRYSCNAIVGRFTMSTGQTAETNLVNATNNHYVAQNDARVLAYRASISGDTPATGPAEGVVVMAPTTAAEAAALVATMGWGADSLMAQSVPEFEASEGDSEATIGEGAEANNKYAPYMPYYNNGLSEQIYTAAEIGKAGTIKALAFDAAAVDSKPLDEKVSIWLGHTTAAGFASASDVISSDLTQVYSADTNIGVATGWDTIKFSKGFEYNGADNLVVVVLREKTGSSSKTWSGSLKYNATVTESETVWQKAQDSNTWTDLEAAIANSASASVSKYRPNIQLTFGTLYSVSVAEGLEHGSINVSAEQASAGDQVTITATPDEGYKLDAVTVTDADNNPVEVTDNTFTMPAKSVTVNATFAGKQDHTVTVATGIQNGTVSVDKAAAKQGATVTVMAVPNTGYELESLTYTPEGGEAQVITGTTFEMPDANVTVNATFREALDLSPALKAESPLSITSTDSNAWNVQVDGDRSYIKTTANGANASVAITSEAPGWLIFDWGFAGSGSWQDEFAYSLSGSTTGSSSIGAGTSTYQGKWVTKVVAIKAGNTTVTWTASNRNGNDLGAAAWLDEVRFVNTQTAVTLTADENTTVSAKVSGEAVTAVDPGTTVSFEAAGANGYLFEGWKTSAEATEDMDAGASFTQVVYDEPVSYYAHSSKPFKGAGTAEDPFQIATMADLQALSGFVANGITFADQYFKVMSDIIATENDDFSGIGKLGAYSASGSTPFCGSFDGANRSISGLKLTNGLFYRLGEGAVVKDLTVSADVETQGTINQAGIIAGYADKIDKISNCTVHGTVKSDRNYVGGIVGNLGSGKSAESPMTIENCVVEAAITTSHSGNTDSYIGGIAGTNSLYAHITGCVVNTTIDTGGKAGGVGGVIGKLTSNGSVDNCIVKATINGNMRIGGIAGIDDASTMIKNCEYNGSITGNDYVGGIVGDLSNRNAEAGVSNCLAYGTVAAAGTGSTAGGIVGKAEYALTIPGCLALQQSITATTAGRIVGTTAGSLWNGEPTLANNAAWADMLVNDAAIASDAATAAADGIDGASIATEGLYGESFAPASTWDAKAWTVAAAAKPQLAGSEAIAALSTAEFPEYIAKPHADRVAADAVEALIAALPEPIEATAETKAVVDEAQAAYDALDEGQKALVSDEAKARLEAVTITATVAANQAAADAAAAEAAAAAEKAAAEAAAAAEKAAADKLAADQVAALIDALPAADAATVDDEDAADEAETAFEALTEDQLALLSDEAKAKLADVVAAVDAAVEAAEEALQAAADKVEALIDALPVADAATAADAVKAKAAQAAYDKLTDEQKALVPADALAKLSATVAAATAKADAAAAEATRIDISKATITVAKATYTGKALTPKVTVKVGTKTLAEGTDYALTYANNTNAGAGVAIVNGKGTYTGVAFKSFTIAQVKNTMTAKAKKKTITAKAKTLKKKNVTIKKSKAFKIAKAKGTVAFTLGSVAKKIQGKVAITEKGKITLYKGIKKGTYKVKVKVTAAGNTNYKKLAKTITLKIKVK